jgi:hypothetical protein
MTENEDRERALVLALLQIGELCNFRVVTSTEGVGRLVATIDRVASVALLEAGVVDLAS